MKFKNALGDFVMLIGGLVIAVLIVSFAFIIYNNQKETSNAVINQGNRMNIQLQESEWTQYDGTVITGAEVVNVIKRMQNSNTYVQVGEKKYCADDGLKNVSDETFSEDLRAAKSKTSDAYINPSTMYEGKVDRDDTKGIKGIIFTKAGESGDAEGVPAGDGG